MREELFAFVLARAGSKRLPKKNLQKIENYSLVELAVKCAKELGVKVFVSSDSEEVLQQANNLGAEALKRPDCLAQDNSTSEETLIYHINSLSLKINDNIVLLQPTSPLRRSSQLEEFLVKSRESGFGKNHNQAISVTRFAGEMWLRNDSNLGLRAKAKWQPNTPRMPSRLSEPWFWENGAIYLTTIEALLRTNSLVGGKVALIETPFLQSIDVDTQEDLDTARKLAALLDG